MVQPVNARVWGGQKGVCVCVQDVVPEPFCALSIAANDDRNITISHLLKKCAALPEFLIALSWYDAGMCNFTHCAFESESAAHIFFCLRRSNIDN